MARKYVEIEWQEPQGWIGKCQEWPTRQIRGKIAAGEEVLVTYHKKKYKAKIVSLRDRPDRQASGKCEVAEGSRKSAGEAPCSSMTDKPKKPKMSISKEEKEAAQVALNEHLQKKESAQQHKKSATEEAKKGEDPKTVVATFDLESVLQLPYSELSPLFYKRKLCVYNLTIYENSSAKKEGHCYLWSEIDGKRGSVEIGSCLLHYIEQLPKDTKKLILFSDSCGGQNRNQFVAAGLLWAAQISALEEIQLCFLESGHTQMECDSMHAAIENARKHKNLFMMNDWMNVMIEARRNNPYKVHRLRFNDFFDLKKFGSSAMMNRNRDVNGKKINWLYVKVLGFRKGETEKMFYKLDHDAELFGEIDVMQDGRGRGRPSNMPDVLPRAYKDVQPISAAKKKDLLDLCRTKVIPGEYSDWYKHLKAAKSAKDYAELEDDELEEDEDADEDADAGEEGELVMSQAGEGDLVVVEHAGEVGELVGDQAGELGELMGGQAGEGEELVGMGETVKVVIE